jgi:hypothetical protein
VLDKAFQKKRICSRVHVFKVPQKCHIAHAPIIQIYGEGCKEDTGGETGERRMMREEG